MSRSRGYTLAELVVVLAILGIVASGVPPAIRAIERDPLELSADEVTRVVLAARNAALQAGASVRLTLNPTNREFRIDRMDDSISVPIAKGVLSLVAGVAIADGPPLRVVFERTGFAPPDSVLLQSPAGTRLVRVGEVPG